MSKYTRACVLLLGLIGLGLIGAAATPAAASAQACPAGRSCFYVPAALPTPPGYTVDWDMTLASPRGTITGTWRAGTGAATAFSISPGTPLVVPLSTTEGTASGFNTAEDRGIFIEASSQELLVDHRLIVGPWQSSSTIKSSSFGLGTRFRLGGYALNNPASADTGYDYTSVYAPFGATVTFTAPTGASAGFWDGHPGTSFSVVLTAGQTYLARTAPGAVCTREIDGALVTSTDPISVDTGGRGWAGICGAAGGCGDDGADNVIPTSGIGQQYVLLDFPSAASSGEYANVIADTDGTQVSVDGAVVATLAAGEVFRIPAFTGTTYVETSQPAYVYENSGLNICELDIALLPPIALSPLGTWTTDFNLPTGFSGDVGVIIATSQVSTLRLDGSAPTFTTNTAVPTRPDLHAVHFSVGAGNHSVSAGADFQLGLVTAGGGTGLFAYYTPFRVPGCGDGTKTASEGCDDGNLIDGDGCSGSCRIEVGVSGCTTTTDCVPAARCDAGTCVARCFTDAECNDSNDCTADSCDGTGACVNAPVASGGAGTCAGGLVCTGAPSNTCVSCVSDTQCAGTTPLCDTASNTCVACLAASDCNDSNDCTSDSCAAGACTNAPVASGSPGTCAGGLVCLGSPAVCAAACGDGVIVAPETCDDGNAAAGDGCDASCAIEAGWDCATAGASCTEICGDSMVVGGEACDTGGESASCDADCTAVACGDGNLNLAAGETCDDANTTDGDGCSAICAAESGWSCGCGSPSFSYSMEMSAGRIGGMGGGAGPQMGCTGNDVLIGLAINWSDTRGEGVRTRALCGAVSVDASGAVTTTPTTTEESGGSGCFGWDPATWSPNTTCPVGWAVVGLTGEAAGDLSTPNLFRDLNLVCQQMGVDGNPAGPTMLVNIPGGGGETADTTSQTVSCPSNTIARFFQTRAGCGQDALDLFCGVPAVSCSGSSSICATQCGDGVLGAPDETCDDGNAVAGDGCDASCQIESGWVCSAAGVACAEVCGDSVVVGAEDCDEGAETASCDGDCTAVICGDGRLNTLAGEACDEGASNSDTEPDACRTTCAVASCGDSVVDTGESCDEGAANSDAAGATCRTTCALASCGDGVVDTGEECDDGPGNTDTADSCRTTCVNPACGDGIVDTGEECDDGGANSDTAADACRTSCQVASCGDGVVDMGEACDDGAAGSATCDSMCADVPPEMDAGTPDAGADAGAPDAGADGSVPDADGSVPDADGGSSGFGLSGGALCSAPSGGGRGGFPLLFAMAFGLLVWRRRRR